MTSTLYILTVLIWGTSWWALALQASMAPPVAAVWHRIALAAAIMLAVVAARGGLNRRPVADHLRLAALGACLFSLNFVAYYVASRHLPSGVLAVCFATASLWAALLSRLLFNEPLSGRTLIGGATGVIGVALLALDRPALSGGDLVVGLALALGGAVVFALGNMAAVANRARGLRQDEAVAWGMGYGALFLLIAALLRGDALLPPATWVYAATVLHTAVFSSVIAFAAYLSLVARVGASRAAYATVLFPVIALAMSVALEGFAPGWASVAGVALILAGAGVALGRGRTPVKQI